MCMPSQSGSAISRRSWLLLIPTVQYRKLNLDIVVVKPRPTRATWESLSRGFRAPGLMSFSYSRGEAILAEPTITLLDSLFLEWFKD